MGFCCEALSNPSRFGKAGIQHFIVAIHAQIHDIERDFKQYDHFQARIARGSPESMGKIQAEYQTFLEGFRGAINAFVADMSGPYFGKVQVHYPEIASVLKMFLARISTKAAKLQLTT